MLCSLPDWLTESPTLSEIASLLSDYGYTRFPSRAALTARLASLGYRIDPAMSCTGPTRHLTGALAGLVYTVTTLGVVESDTGLSFAHVNARKPDSCPHAAALRSLRLSGAFYTTPTRLYSL